MCFTEHLKTSFERRREEELMSKLMGIVNDRNAIVEGLDEDRLRCACETKTTFIVCLLNRV